MKRLLIYLKDYRKECVLAPLFKMLEACFELFVPLVVAAIVDVGIAGGDKSYILSRTAIMVLLGLIGLLCSVTAQYFSARAAVGFSTRLRSVLFAHIQSLSFTELDRVGVSTLITRLTSDINQVQNGINLVLRLFLRSPFIVFGAMIMAFTVDAGAALVFVVTIPLLSVVVFGVMLISIPMYKGVQQALDGVLSKTRENLTGVRVIRAFHREEQEIREFDERNSRLNALQRRVGKFSALMNPVTFIIVNMALVVLLYAGGVKVDTGVLTQGQVIALVNYMSQILVELVKLANLIISVTKAVACGNRISSVLELSSSQQKGILTDLECPDPDHYLVFDHASFAYAGSQEESLSDITFTVKKGQTIGIIGGTGSGKTTLAHLIPRFYDVTGGSIRLNGKELNTYDIPALRSRIGMVMQKAVLFQGTLRENLQWGNEAATDEELLSAARTAQALEVIRGKEKGLDELVEPGGKNFSGGQRQRLTIARALVRRPDILILDDSASALDYATDLALRRAIAEAGGNMTTFIISQRTASIHGADQILVLEDGHMAGLGTHEQLIKDCPVYREIHESQFKKEEA